MTIFELLDRLETEIVSLRSQNRELRYSLYRVQANGTSTAAATGDRKTASTKKKKAKAKPDKRTGTKAKAKAKSKGKKKSPAKKTMKQLPLPVGDVELESIRSLGKRQALGKSLLQLRRTAVSHSTS